MPARVAQWVAATLQTKPAGAKHWSTRTMARAEGVSQNTIHRILRDHGLKPHLAKLLQTVPRSEVSGEAHRRVGRIPTPPQNALVLYVDEKSQT